MPQGMVGVGAGEEAVVSETVMAGGRGIECAPGFLGLKNWVVQLGDQDLLKNTFIMPFKYLQKLFKTFSHLLLCPIIFIFCFTFWNH